MPLQPAKGQIRKNHNTKEEKDVNDKKRLEAIDWVACSPIEGQIETTHPAIKRSLKRSESIRRQPPELERLALTISRSSAYLFGWISEFSTGTAWKVAGCVTADIENSSNGSPEFNLPWVGLYKHQTQVYIAGYIGWYAIDRESFQGSLFRRCCAVRWPESSVRRNRPIQSPATNNKIQQTSEKGNSNLFIFFVARYLNITC